MQKHYINLKQEVNVIYDTLNHLQGTNPVGEHISFTNHYMKKNDKPFFGICGEFHFSRYNWHKWEDEIIKMKMAGINIIPTYIIWNHHEEIKGQFRWNGNFNIRYFIQLCQKHDVNVILRVGPFVHGEARNGGLPDWLYGEPCRVRSNDKRYLFYVERYYHEIGQQIRGLMYKDGGPVIGVQLDNEYCHAGAPWEMTTGTSNEWISNGTYDTDDAEHHKHIETLKEFAVKAGLIAPIYTGTGWGGAYASPDTVLPLWGGYAFWPWIFYDESIKEHPVTPEFIYRNYRKPTYNFEPAYDPTTVPFACCEMGGGMTVFYKYRFQLPYHSVEAMANIKVAGGCNFVGYYVFHGGSNPLGLKTPYLNENATPKISYDYQAAIGEFGQVRDSYNRLKRLHYFFHTFQNEFCPTQTVLPDGAEDIAPTDVEKLRFAVRIDKNKGFIFINNYQDHLVSPDKKDFAFTLDLADEILTVPQKGSLSLNSEESCILPFNFTMDSLTLKYATAQLITKIEQNGEKSYFFFMPQGMQPQYCFSKEHIKDISIDGGNIEYAENCIFIQPANDKLSKTVITDDNAQKINIYTLTAQQSLNFWQFEYQGRTCVLLSAQPVLADKNGIRFEACSNEITVYNIDNLMNAALFKNAADKNTDGLLTSYTLRQTAKDIMFTTENIDKGKILVHVDTDKLPELKDALLQIDYQGDIGYAFVENELVADNFANGATWEIGLNNIFSKTPNSEIFISISPLKEQQIIKSDTPMAGRSEEDGNAVVSIDDIKIQPIYEFIL